MCLQETHLKEEEEKWLRKLFKSAIFHAHSHTRSKGLMLGIAENAYWETHATLTDETEDM